MDKLKSYFEDIRVGDTVEVGDRLVTAEDIVEFARQFDPQPFHLDEEAGRQTFFGGLVASGWHTAAMMMRMVVDHALSPETSLGSPGIDELRWLKPVRPGDRLRVRITVLECVPSRSKPDRGLVRQQIEVLKQDDEVVMRLTALGLIRTKAGTPAAGDPSIGGSP